MWKCHLCNVSFTKESVQHHLFIHHIRPKIGNPQVYNCGDCIFSAEDFEAIAEHCLSVYHEPTKVSKGLDYERYPAQLLRSLKTVMRSSPYNPAAGGGRDQFAARKRGISPDNGTVDDRRRRSASAVPGGGEKDRFQHYNRRPADLSYEAAVGRPMDWSEISFQADETVHGESESGDDEVNPFSVFGGSAGLGQEYEQAEGNPEHLENGQENPNKRKSNGTDTDNNKSNKKFSKKSIKNEADKERQPEEPPRPEPISPLDIGNYIYAWQDLPNPYKITLLGTFWKPNDRFPYPYVQYGEGVKKRRCRFSGRWFASYSWLAYTQLEGGGALCAPCVLFNESPKRGSLVQRPFQKYKNGLERFARHSETLWHRQAIQSMELAATEFQAAAEEKDEVVDSSELLEKLREAKEKYKGQSETDETAQNETDTDKTDETETDTEKPVENEAVADKTAEAGEVIEENTEEKINTEPPPSDSEAAEKEHTLKYEPAAECSDDTIENHSSSITTELQK